MDIDEVAVLLTKYRGKTVVLVGGVFDLTHVGHLRYLQRAKQLGDILVVHVDDDARTAKRKGCIRPIVPVAERIEIVSGFACVDYVITSDSAYHESLIVEKIQPDIIVRSDRGSQSSPQELHGARVVYLTEDSSIHTTSLISRMVPSEQSVEMQKAKLAARNGYSYSGAKIGACVVTSDGSMYVGHNVSNASPAITMCAERMAIYAALADKQQLITDVYLYSESKSITTPCGSCRQVIAEFSATHDIRIYMSNGRETKPSSIAMLLPFPFTSSRSTERRQAVAVSIDSGL